MYLDSSDLELVFDKGIQKVGMRFTNVSVPKGASVSNAYVQFTADETSSELTDLTIDGELVPDATAFGSIGEDITSRSRTSSAVRWQPAGWSSRGAAGEAQRTPNIASIIEEIVGQTGWASGQAIVIIVEGSGERVAESYDGDESAAPLLHIAYEVGGMSTSTTSTTTSSAASSTVTSTTLQPADSGATPPDLSVMYIADGPLDDQKAADIYGLANAKGVEAIVHGGDLDYTDDPDAFWGRVHTHLGTDFPYFVSIGNHDDLAWPQYSAEGIAQCGRNPDAICTGDYGVNSTVSYKGLTIVLSGVGEMGSGHEAYIRQQLDASTSIWKVCSWHKNQTETQLGGKGNETGWSVYEACRELGAFVVTGHEHTYERTKTLSGISTLTVDPTAPDRNLLFIGPGRTFVVVSGLAGRTVRDQQRCVGPNGPCTTEGNQCVFSTGTGCNDIWAAFYGGDQYGGLIVSYHVDGNPWKARGKFFSVDGTLRDEFVVFSENGSYVASTSTTTSTTSSTTTSSTSTTIPPTTTTTTSTSTTTSSSTTSTTLGPPIVFDTRVASSSDDAEERDDGSVSLSSSDLEMSYDRTPQIVGMRFTNVPCPAGYQVTQAWLQFQVDEASSIASALTIRGQLIGDAPAFASSTDDLSGRQTTAASIEWNPPAWGSVGQAGSGQQSPDIADVIEEILTADGWSAGNALVLLVTGDSGSKNESHIAESFDGDSGGAPLLHVECAGGAPTTTTSSSTTTSSTSSTSTSTSTTATTTTTASTGPTSTTTSSTTTTSPTSTTSSSLPPAPDVLDRRVASTNDDAEERESGDMYLDSSDLELVYDKGNQKVGLRFVDVTIPKGASVSSAYVQFQVDETPSGSTDLTIRGELTGDAAPFTSAFEDITSRTRTAASVGWQPPAWPDQGAAGFEQQTEDIAPVIEEIVNGPDWTAGNALVLFIEGTGERVAESYDGDQAGAPLLHVVYNAP